MRILSVHNRYVYAGGEDGVREAEANLLAARGHQVVRYDEDNRRIGELNKLRVGLRTLWSLESYRALRRVIRGEQIELVHVHNYLPLISPSVYTAARAEGAAVVQTLHNYRLLCPSGIFYRDGHLCTDCLHRRWKTPAIRHACYRESRTASAAVAAMLYLHRTLLDHDQMVDAYIALTEFSRGQFLTGGLPPGKLHLKPNFVDPDPGPGNHEGGFALFVGRITPEKGAVRLVEWWRDAGIEMPLRIAGTGPEEGALRAAAAGAPRVECLGFVEKEQVAQLMKDAGFLVFPSTWFEGLPLTLLEAFAVGLPVVAADLGSMSSLIVHEQTGLHYPADDPGAAADTLRRAATSPDFMRTLGRRARTEFVGKYTAERNYETLMHIYESALRGRPARARRAR